jgi:hypothetical protein
MLDPQLVWERIAQQRMGSGLHKCIQRCNWIENNLTGQGCSATQKLELGRLARAPWPTRVSAPWLSSGQARRQRGASRQQTNTCETGGFVLPGRVKQRKHESADVSFCDPVQSTGYSKQTIKFYYLLICNSPVDTPYDCNFLKLGSYPIKSKHFSFR